MGSLFSRPPKVEILGFIESQRRVNLKVGKRQLSAPLSRSGHLALVDNKWVVVVTDRFCPDAPIGDILPYDRSFRACFEDYGTN